MMAQSVICMSRVSCLLATVQLLTAPNSIVAKTIYCIEIQRLGNRKRDRQTKARTMNLSRKSYIFG